MVEYDNWLLRVEDLEHDPYAYGATCRILSIPGNSLDKLINMILDEFAKVFDIKKIPKTDKGPYEQLLLCLAIQKRICSARDPITTVVDRVVI